MLDALRHHRAASRTRDGAPNRGTAGHNVPAPLAQALGRKPPEEGGGTGKRLALAIVLVAVTALLVWQVAAMHGLLPAGPLSRILRPAAVDRAQSSPAPGPPSRATLPPGQNRSPAAVVAPQEPELRQPVGPDAADARDARRTSQPSGPAEPPSPPARELRPADTNPGAATPGAVRAESASSPRVQARKEAAAPPAGAGATGRSGGRATVPPPRPPGATDHFTLALYYQRVGDFENALIHYRAVIAADELNAEAHNNLGVLYQGKGLYDEAISEFQRATYIDPRYDKAHNNLGVALLRSGKTDAAIGEFRGIVARDARNVEALTNLALALKAAGRAEEARETLQRALTINGRYAQAHYNLALIYEERAEWQRAIEHFEQFLANAGSESAALTVDVRTRVQTLRARLQ
jgi:Tfp pilus assembly protein PilF